MYVCMYMYVYVYIYIYIPCSHDHHVNNKRKTVRTIGGAGGYPPNTIRPFWVKLALPPSAPMGHWGLRCVSTSHVTTRYDIRPTRARCPVEGLRWSSVFGLPIALTVYGASKLQTELPAPAGFGRWGEECWQKYRDTHLASSRLLERVQETC